MNIEQVRAYFKQFGLDHRIHEFAVSSATVDLAAQALGCEPRRIAKTLSFKINDGCILLVTAGDVRVDNPKFKAKFGVKARMLTHDEALVVTGYAVGGVCPFLVADGVQVYLDESLKRFQTVYPACGNSSSGIELTIPELELHSGYREWVDVCKGWNEA